MPSSAALAAPPARRARPKSLSFRFPARSPGGPASSTLEGFTSPCTMSNRPAHASARAICTPIRETNSYGSGPSPRTFESVGPSISSIARNGSAGSGLTK